MRFTRLGAIAALLAVCVAGSADARDWVAVGMKKIPVREYASAAAPVVDMIDGGSYLNLTGKCTRELDLDIIAYMHAFQQKALVSTRWCELAGPRGWIFGGFMKPF
jgi:hypothetical protein